MARREGEGERERGRGRTKENEGERWRVVYVGTNPGTLGRYHRNYIEVPHDPRDTQASHALHFSQGIFYIYFDYFIIVYYLSLLFSILFCSIS